MVAKNQCEKLGDLGKFMTAFGWVIVGMSVLLGVVSMGAFSEGLTRQASLVMGLIVIIVGSVSGIIMAAVGHVMLYLVEIGERTRGMTTETASPPADFSLPQSVAA